MNENLFKFELGELVSRECNESTTTPENVTCESKIVNRNSTRENRESNIVNRNSSREPCAHDVVRESSTFNRNPVRRSSRRKKTARFLYSLTVGRVVMYRLIFGYQTVNSSK